MPASLDRLIYVDDSGRPQDGTAVYGWIEFSPDRWAHVLKTWLDTRKKLWREYSIPVVKELHTTGYVNGRDRISNRIPDSYIHDGAEHWKDLGRDVATECLETLRCTEGLRVGAVWRKGRPADISHTRQAAYTALIQRFEAELAATGTLAMVFMDGDGTDPAYRTTHRSLRLTERRVIEDAIHLDSAASQLVQMADLVAWTANSHIDRHEGNKFAWHWYTRYLAERDPHRQPRNI